MNSFNAKRIPSCVIVAAAIALSATSGITMAAPVTLDVNCAPRLQGMDQKLYDKAHEGAAALRNFISMRRSFVFNDIVETADWAAGIDRARDRCLDAKAIVARSEGR